MQIALQAWICHLKRLLVIKVKLLNLQTTFRSLHHLICVMASNTVRRFYSSPTIGRYRMYIYVRGQQEYSNRCRKVSTTTYTVKHLSSGSIDGSSMFFYTILDENVCLYFQTTAVDRSKLLTKNIASVTENYYVREQNRTEYNC